MPQGEIITITGHLGRDPEDIKKDGNVIGLKFSVGVGHGYKDKTTGQWVNTETNWWNVLAYGAAADTLRNSFDLRKGRCVRVQSREVIATAWTDKDGKVRPQLALKVWDGDVAIVLHKPKGTSSSGPDYSAYAPESDGQPASLRDEPDYIEQPFAADAKVPF